VNNAVKVLQAAAAGIGFGAVLVVLAALAGAVVYVGTLLSDPETARGVAAVWVEQASDSFTEAGFGAGALNPDDPLLRSRVIVLTEAVNERTARRVIESLVYLDRLDSEAPITLYLATSGGWLDPAFAIVDAMQRVKAPVDTIATGGCFSAGAVILAAGTGTRAATPNAILSVHANSDEGGDALSYERLSRERLERHFRQNATLPPEWFPLTGDKTYYLTPEEAVKYGLVDRIEIPKS